MRLKIASIARIVKQLKSRRFRLDLMMRFNNIQILSSRVVFDPRTETEFWVKQALAEIKEISRDLTSANLPIRVLDIFSGTGCIGIFLLKNSDNSFVDFVDISPQAIEQIRINLDLNKIGKKRCRIFQSDMFEGLREERLTARRNEIQSFGYDFVFANPPYVALERAHEIGEDILANDPNLALLAGNDGLLIIKEFLNQVDDFLKPKGIFFMEFDPLQKSEIEKILKEKGFDFDFRQDQFQEWRWLRARI